jgi:acyl-CoA synthetase
MSESPQTEELRSVAELLTDRAARCGHASAYLTGKTTVSWGQYDETSSRFAGLLLRLGIEPGERLAVLLPDGPEVHIAYVGAEKAGLVVVGISRRVGLHELEHALRVTRAAGFVSNAAHQDRSTSQLVDELRKAGLAIRHHLIVQGDLAEGESILVNGSPVDLSPCDSSVDTRRQGRRLAPEDLFLLNFTSGTTGLPKCVKHNQKRWMSFHEFAVEAGDLTSADVFMSVVPTPFGFGIWSSHVTPVILGVPTVLMPRFSPDEALALVERHHVTVLGAVATQFIMMLNSPAMGQHDLTSLRVLFTGGEVVPSERAAEFEDRTGARVLQFYGSNEVGAVSRTSLRDPREKRLGTAGRVIPAMNVRLFDDRGNDVTARGRGQPGCKGPTLSGGYYADDAANAKLIRPDGWMLLGDIVQIDDEGYLQVVGRTDDFIIRGGKTISAAAVEQQVSTHPAVALAAAVSMPDDVYGERVCVYVELRAEGSLNLDDLLAHLAARNVSKETWPERLIVVPELPRNPGGKLAKKQLRDDIARRVAAERSAAPSPT